jgi:hypothetical protein
MGSLRTPTVVAMALVCSVSWVHAGDGRISAEIVSPEALTIKPGSVLKASVVVSNHSEAAAPLEETLEIPQSWQLVTPQNPSFTVGSGRTDLRLLVIRVPHAYPAGSYVVSYKVSSRTDPGLEDHVSLNVGVMREARLSILVVDKPEVVIAGELWQAHLLIVNEGNDESVLQVSALAVPRADASIEPREMALAPGESGDFVVSVGTDSDLNYKARYTIDVKAVSGAVGEGRVSLTETLWFDVVPQVTGDPDPYHRVPSQLKLITAFEGGHRRQQFDLSASGSIDEAGNRKIGFLLRGPDIENFGRYGRRDEYWLAYEDGQRSLIIGDKTYELSHLTQRFSYGRGGQITLHSGDFDFGGLYLEPRQNAGGPRRVGGRIAYVPDPGLAVAWNMLVKAGDSTLCEGCYRSRTYSVEAGISPDERMDLSVEYGISHISGLDTSYVEQGLEAHAYRLESRGRLSGDVRYSLERIYAGPRYAGYYQAATHTIASLLFPIYGGLRGSFYYHSYEDNPAGLRIKTLAEKVMSLKSGLSYQPGRGLNVSLDYVGYHKRDMLDPPDHDFHEKTLVLGVGKIFRKLSLHGNVEYGTVVDHLTDSPATDLVRYSFSTHLRPTDGQTYTVYTRVGHSRFSEDPAKDWSAGLSARLRLGRRVRFHVDYVTSRRDAPDVWRRNSLFSTVSVELPHGHSISLRGHLFEHNRGEDGREGSAFLVYGIPIGLPTGRRSSTGSLKGRLYDAELAGGAPLAGVVLSANGAYAVSQANGEFTFPALKPGSYMLQVDPRSIGAGKVTTAELPIPFDVEGGKTTALDIGVVTACRVAGEVKLFEFAAGTQVPRLFGASNGTQQQPLMTIQPDSASVGLTEVGGVRILVEITDGAQTLRQYTGLDGRFDFQQIRPGVWHIRFHEHDVPELHHVEHREVVVELEPGEETFVVTRVIPEVRPIRIIDTGSIKMAGGAE